MRFIRQGALHSDLYAASGIPCRCHRWGLADSFKRSVSAANVRSGAPLGCIVVNKKIGFAHRICVSFFQLVLDGGRGARIAI
jgi:hypothetical protein